MKNHDLIEPSELYCARVSEFVPEIYCSRLADNFVSGFGGTIGFDGTNCSDGTNDLESSVFGGRNRFGIGSLHESFRKQLIILLYSIQSSSNTIEAASIKKTT